jgi:hypothetical protein
MSFNAAALRLMANKGLTALDIAEIAEAAETGRSSGDRERKREQRELERLSGGQSGGMSARIPPDPAPNERDNLTPTRKEKPKPIGLVKKTERGSRLPEDWEPKPLTGRAAEMVAAWQPGQLERELAKFKNYWPAKGSNAARTDWQRTWVNWLIAADERKPRLIHERSSNPTATALQRVLGTSH